MDQTPETIEGLKLTMSIIPGSVAGLAAASVLFYRIDANREKEMEAAIASQAKDELDNPTNCPA